MNCTPTALKMNIWKGLRGTTCTFLLSHLTESHPLARALPAAFPLGAGSQMLPLVSQSLIFTMTWIRNWMKLPLVSPSGHLWHLLEVPQEAAQWTILGNNHTDSGMPCHQDNLLVILLGLVLQMRIGLAQDQPPGPHQGLHHRVGSADILALKSVTSVPFLLIILPLHHQDILLGAVSRKTRGWILLSMVSVPAFRLSSVVEIPTSLLRQGRPPRIKLQLFLGKRSFVLKTRAIYLHPLKLQ